MTTLVPEPSGVVERKLRPPRQRPELFARPRLLDEVDRLKSCALTLVDAPVGFGKTVLVQTWCSRNAPAVAWVSLDSGDDDPARFWTHVATAVDRIREGLGRTALARLRSPGVPTDAAIDELLKGIAAYDAPLVIALDDLHAITSQECLSSIENAVEHLPGNSRIVTTTRSDPPLALGRLRGRGALGEIRARQLAFDADETRCVLEREGVVLSDAAVGLLVERTEGWPAGVYLAALWLRTLDDPETHVREFHGDHRHLAEYLSAEILDTLDADTRRFLVDTAVLERFTPALCDAVLERTDSAAKIAELERTNLFVVSLDARGEWYRYHHLFAELLRLELAGDEAEVTRLRRRACTWCREHQLLDDALEHAAAASDWETLATLLAENHFELAVRRPATLLRWAGLLTDTSLLDHPTVAVAGVNATRIARRPVHERARYDTIAQRSRSERPETWSSYEEFHLLIAGADCIETDLGVAAQKARQALAVARGDASPSVIPALAAQSLCAFLAGDLDEARQAAGEAVAFPAADTRPHGYVYALALQSLVENEQSVPSAEARGRHALAEGHRLGLDETPTVGFAHTAMAAVLMAAGRDREALREAPEGERLRRQPSPELVHAYSLIVLGRAQARRGRVTEASTSLDEARAILGSFDDVGRLREQLTAAHHELEGTRSAGAASHEPLSDAELAVLRLLSSDLSQREIAAKLYLSHNTIKTHTRLIYRKLGVGSRDEAVARALAFGLDAPRESPG